MPGESALIDLRGKRALVTGGSRGVGRATARMLAAAGADVGIAYRSRSADADATLAELRAAGVRAWAQPGDLSDERAVDVLFARVEREFGALDLFIGNAGIWPHEDVPIARMDSAQWRRTLAVNLDAVFLTTRAAARVITDDGRIVLVGSTAGQRGEAGHADYAASKGAIISLVKGVAIELAARRITVNCVAPGWIDTEMAAAPYVGDGRARIEVAIPLGRVASAEDVAGPIVFLCSELARHITGEVLNVNGGSVLCG
ncbi:MAG TPA: SDR family NAD(P)-dependent oxidoreductase [Longimicrobiales bacterium]|nr:SDR family NAD(P)-dependent oxidoreductase [Longimicrobiales bacterium]